MLSPGSKGWIDKYFSLVDEGKILLTYPSIPNVSSAAYVHLLSAQTGFIFGIPSHFLFYQLKDKDNWTNDEKLKVLLFETLLLEFLLKNKDRSNLKNNFVESVMKFYPQVSNSIFQNILSFWGKESNTVQLENSLSKRITVSSSIFDSRWLLKSVGNVFIYLDIIIYRRFLNFNEEKVIANYSEYAYNALVAISMAAHADGKVDDKEIEFYDLFLNAANLEDEYHQKAELFIKNEPTFSDFSDLVQKDKQLARFIVDLTVLTIFRNHIVETVETDFVRNLIQYFEMNQQDLDESLIMIEHFLLNSDIKNSFLSNKNTYEKIYGNMTSRWSKILIRNKDRIALELSESKELISLINKSRSQELTADEKEKVKSQFMDIIKTVPALTIFMLPGGAILLPLILKIVPDLIPSSFKTNEIE
jgi:hypothetical protein